MNLRENCVRINGISTKPKQSLIPVIILDQEGIGDIGVRKFML